MRLLFITWDGPGTSYHESLFLPLLTRARRPGDTLGLLQFSWGAEERVVRLGAIARAQDVDYRHVPVPRGRGVWRLPAVLLRALIAVRRDVLAGDYDTVMPRSMVPGGFALCLAATTRGPFRTIYDADGLAADERVEFGGWRRWGLRYRTFRLLERMSVRRAEMVVTRTQRGIDVLRRRTGVPAERFAVVVNGKDPEAFRPAAGGEREETRAMLGVPPDAPVLVQVGSVGPQYLPEFMIRIYRAVLRLDPEARLLVLAARMHHDRLRALAPDLGPDRMIIVEATPEDVPVYLGASDVGLATRMPTFSQRGVAPIKIAEYLLCGLPVVYSRGVGDLDEQLPDTVGLATHGTSREEADGIAGWITDTVLPQRAAIGHEARRVGVDRFSVQVGADSYRRVFDRLEGRR